MKINEVIGEMIKRQTRTRAEEPETAPDALTLMHQDHEEVNALFERALDDGTPAAQRRAAVGQICDALTVHAKMEEAIFYPALRRAGKTKERDSVLEAGEEHGMVKDMIAKIRRIRGRDETLKAKLTVLKELVRHHVAEEESTIFTEARSVLGGKLDALGEEMQRFKERAQRPAARRSATGRPAARKAGAARKTSPARGARTTTRRKAR